MIDSETVLASSVLKLSVARDALAERLGLVARGVSSRTAVLVLGGIQLRASDGRLQLAATDMELSLRASLDAEVDGEGEVVVPGRLLLDIVRALPENEVELEHRGDEAMLVVRSGAASYRVHTYASEDFPRLPDVDTLQLHLVDRDALLETIGRVGGGGGGGGGRRGGGGGGGRGEASRRLL
jgi:DNA polymerase-3 subunit beta